MASEEPLKEIHGTCPTPSELGHSGWNILHSSAAMFPHNPSPEQREAFSKLMHGWSHLYACSHCAYHMRRYLAKNPPIVTDKFSASRYMCEFHNVVNRSVGKRIYDCDPMVVLRRWHPTFPDMEDEPTVEEQIAEQRRLDAEAIMEKQRKREAEEERLAAIGGAPQRRTAEEWREVNSRVGTFATGWSSGPRSSGSPSQTEAMPARAQQQQEEQQQQQERKKWWFFGGSAVRSDATVGDAKDKKYTKAPETHLGVAGAANTARADSVSALGIGEKAADDETDVFAIMKRLKACMVYCPDQDKGKGKEGM